MKPSRPKARPPQALELAGGRLTRRKCRTCEALFVPFSRFDHYCNECWAEAQTKLAGGFIPRRRSGYVH